MKRKETASQKQTPDSSLPEAQPRGALPRLRFPEFKGDGEWVEKSLGDACDVNPSTDDIPESFIYIDLESVEDGVLLSRKQYEKEKAPSRAQRVLCDGDVIFQMVRPYQKNNLIFQQEGLLRYVASTGYSQLRAHDSPAFLYYLVYQDSFVKKVLSKCTGSSYPAINSTDLAEISVHIPSAVEQQKIADCLSSLDDLIAAHNRKLDALKTHKKGLMQQLFPAEGETVPRLRFPEFKDAGEWTYVYLGDAGENLDYKRIPITESERISGTTPYYGASGIVDYVYGHIFDEDILCISEDGANLVARTYPIAFSVFGKSWVNNHAHVMKFTNNATREIIENYLNFIDLKNFITGMAQPKLNRAMLDIISIPLPSPPEQQKIADCLSSLDSLIAAEAKEVESLNVHKKGLMQALFPDPAGADA